MRKCNDFPCHCEPVRTLAWRPEHKVRGSALGVQSPGTMSVIARCTGRFPRPVGPRNDNGGKAYKFCPGGLRGSSIAFGRIFAWPVIQLASGVGERFWHRLRFGKRRYTLCISSFSNREAGTKDPLTTADNLINGHAYYLAATTRVVAAAAVVVAHQAVAAAVAQQQDDEDDPANITAAETIVTHNQIPPKFVAVNHRSFQDIPITEKGSKFISKGRRGKRPGQPAP